MGGWLYRDNDNDSIIFKSILKQYFVSDYIEFKMFCCIYIKFVLIYAFIYAFIYTFPNASVSLHYFVCLYFAQ